MNKIFELLKSATQYDLDCVNKIMQDQPLTEIGGDVLAFKPEFQPENGGESVSGFADKEVGAGELADLLIAVATLDEITAITEHQDCPVLIGVSGKASRLKRPQN